MDALTTPSNWQKIRLGDICEIVKGQQINKISLNNTDKYPVINGGIDFLGYTNKFNISKNTIAISEGGTCGYVRFMTSDFWSGGHNYSLQKISNKVNNLCLYHILKSYEKDIMKLGVGSGLKNIQLKTLKDFEILLPPLNEQIAIANILSDLDHYLCSLDALILKKESVKKALSFELLSQRKRLKGFNQAWQKVRLGDICYLKNGFSFKSDLFKNMGIPIIRISNISSVDNCINTNDLVFYDPILIDNDYILKQGDLILAMSGATTGKSCLYNLNKIAYLNQRVGVFRAKTSFCYDFLVQFVFSELFTSRLKLILAAGAQPNISSFDIEDFEILLPPLNEQIAIANILSALDSEIISLKNKKRQFENIKKALNHDLMSAKIRVLKE
ncbi:restriction endonuclease subunit S [Helicobacter pylori]|uniref:restriction endonuclease subunit S n=1 Tax=Helicobacter pylori TaxID=210 RepID=UPI000BEAB64C|nr:restriction endonuclease subunit S [Helicobacter pylori]PDW46459.1 restriction endonuclease subunit S [Helicobacter pylori]